MLPPFLRPKTLLFLATFAIVWTRLLVHLNTFPQFLVGAIFNRVHIVFVHVLEQVELVLRCAFANLCDNRAHIRATAMLRPVRTRLHKVFQVRQNVT